MDWTKEIYFLQTTQHCQACSKKTNIMWLHWQACTILEERFYCEECSQKFELMLKLAE